MHVCVHHSESDITSQEPRPAVVWEKDGMRLLCQICHSLPCNVLQHLQLEDGEDNSMSWPQMRIQHLACQPRSSYKRRARAHAWHKASCTVAAATWSQSCWHTHKHISSPFSSGHLSAGQPQFRQQQRPLQPCQMLFACQHVAGEPHGPLPRLRGSCTQSTLSV